MIRPLVAVCASVTVLGAATVHGTVSFTKVPPPVLLAWDGSDTSFKSGDPIVIGQKNRIFSKMLVVVPSGGSVVFRNDDDQQHSVFTEDKASGVQADHGLHQPSESVTQQVTWPSGGVVRFGCRIHPQMQVWIASLSSARHQAVELPQGAKEATFTLTGVAADAPITVWTSRSDLLTAPAINGSVDLFYKGKSCGSLRLTVEP